LREFYRLEVVAEVAPRVGTGVLGDAIEEQRKDRERHVGVK
jgi:hypothetical protein